MRRLDGLGAAHSAARAAYLAGFAGTATTAAARDLGIPATGTMAHAKVMARGPAGELDVFCDGLRARPAGATLLVDTYDTLEGVRRAIAAQAADRRAAEGDPDRLRRPRRAGASARASCSTRPA